MTVTKYPEHILLRELLPTAYRQRILVCCCMTAYSGNHVLRSEDLTDVDLPPKKRRNLNKIKHYWWIIRKSKQQKKNVSCDDRKNLEPLLCMIRIKKRDDTYNGK